MFSWFIQIYHFQHAIYETFFFRISSSNVAFEFAENIVSFSLTNIFFRPSFFSLINEDMTKFLLYVVALTIDWGRTSNLRDNCDIFIRIDNYHAD